MSISSVFRLEKGLKDSWQKEKELLKKVNSVQDKSSINLLKKEVEKIESELSETENLLKKVSKEKNLPESKIKKYQESFFLLSEVAREVDSFLNFQLSSEEESKILAELAWRLTLLSGKLAGSYNLISVGKFEEAKKGIQQAKTELKDCKSLFNEVSKRVSLGLEEINNYLSKIELLINMAENLTNQRKITPEEKEFFAKTLKEPFSSSLDVFSLAEQNRDELIKQANLKLNEVAQKLNIR